MDEPTGPPSRGAALRARIARDRLPIAFGIMIALFYGLTMILNGDVAPGLVGGALGGLLAYLVMREAEQRQRRRRAAQDRPPADG